LHEVKHDGFRVLALKQGERVKVWSRRGADFTARPQDRPWGWFFPSFCRLLVDMQNKLAELRAASAAAAGISAS
jgi:ATP-dependent DNA ligase